MAAGQPDSGDGRCPADEHGAEGVRDRAAGMGGGEGCGFCGEGAVCGEPAEAAGADAEPDATAPPSIEVWSASSSSNAPSRKAPATLMPSVATGTPAHFGTSVVIRYRRPVPMAPPTATSPMFAHDRCTGRGRCC